MISSEEVLEQAREALVSHRTWMTKRHVRNSVAPASSIEDEPPLEETEHLFRPKTVQQFEAAPPLSRGAVSGCVSVRRTAKRIKLIHNKMVPAVGCSLGASQEGDNGETHLRPFLVSPSCQSNGLVNGFSTNFSPKRAWESATDCLQRAQPVTISHSRVEQGIAIHQTSQGGVPHRKMGNMRISTSPPPPPMSKTAWGSLSSLDNNVDSMVTLNKNDKIRRHSQSRETSPRNACNTEGSSSSEEEESNYQLALAGQSREQIGVAGPSPRSDNNSSCRNEEESFKNEEHFKSWNTSSTTLVTVIPAPRERRTTFAAHKHSKLDSAEAGGNVYSFEFCSHASGSETSTSMASNDFGDGEECALHGGIPEPNVKLVLPREEAKKRVSRLSKSGSLKPAFSGDPTGTRREDEVAENSGVQICRDKVLEEPGEGNLARRHNEPATWKTPETLEGDEVELERVESEGKNFDPNGESKCKERRGTETEVKPRSPTEGSHLTQDGTHSSVVHVEGSTSYHNQEIETGCSPTMSSAEAEKPLKALQDTDIYRGSTIHRKCSRTPPGYDIHRPIERSMFPPPCPLYGEKWPPENEVPVRQLGWQKSDGGDTAKPTASQTKPAGETQTHRHALTVCSLSEMMESPTSLHLSSSSISSSSSSVISLPRGPGPLHIAAKLGNLRHLQALLGQGHDVDMPDDAGRTPLMYCIQPQGVHLSCADALIKCGANLDEQASDGATAMHRAASTGALSLLQLLLLNKAKADLQDFEGRQPIHWATLQKNPRVFTALLKNLPPSGGGLECTDEAGMTVLMWAAYHDNHAIVSFLLDQGADTEEKDKDGYTAMHWAIHRGSSQTLQLLLKPDMTYFKDFKGKTIMHVAAERGSMVACEVVLKLRSDAIHDRDKKGRTPLHYAAACSRVDVSALLLDYGADASQKDAMLKTPLDYAREKKLDYVVALLSCHGNAVSDFARASRSARVSSAVNPSIRFQRPQMCREQGNENVVPIAGSGGTFSLSVLPASSRGSAIPVATMADNNASACAATDLNVMEGGYLGRFFLEEKAFLRHYYFCLDEEEGSIKWSRSRDGFFRTRSKALVLEAHKGPSDAVKNHPKFSASLHCFSFWVGTSNSVLDLLAYSEDAYEIWLTRLKCVARRNAGMSRGSVLTFKATSVHRGRPLSYHGTSRQASRSAVFPGGMAMVELDVSSIDGCATTMDTSVFVRDRREASSKDVGHSQASIPPPSPNCPL